MAVTFDKNLFIQFKPNLLWTQKGQWTGRDGFRYTFRWEAIRSGGNTTIPLFILTMNVEETLDDKVVCLFELYANKMRHPLGNASVLIDTQKKEFSPYDQDVGLEEFLTSEYGITQSVLFVNIQGRAYPFAPSQFVIFREARIDAATQRIKIITIVESKISASASASVFQVREAEINLKTVNTEDERSIGVYETKEAAIEVAKATLDEMTNAGMEDVPATLGSFWQDPDKHSLTKDTAKLRNMRKKIKEKLDEMDLDMLDPSTDNGVDPDGLFTKAQATPPSIGQWFSGALPNPDTLEPFLGTPNVDASGIRSSFNGVDEAISLVNQFDSSLLSNVAMIFNTSGGAFGVYVPALDEMIKSSKVKKTLGQMGYSVEDKADGSFVAIAEKPELANQDVQAVINGLYGQLKLKGGNTIGVNIQKIIQATQNDARQSGITEAQDIRDIGILHLGATVVHECVHAKGEHSEGPSETAEQRFMMWALPKINEKMLQRYKSSQREQEFSPLQISPSQRRQASSWYQEATKRWSIKTAQFGAQFSTKDAWKNTSTPSWAAMFSNKNLDSTEALLGRVRNEDVAKGNASFEQRLQKYRSYKGKDTTPSDDSTEERLARDHNYFDGYKSIEEHLEDRRTKPLSFSLPKQASVKIAGYNSMFGWMNNLDLPYEERVIDGDFAEYTLWLDWGNEGRKRPSSEDPNRSSNPRNLPRRNPEYKDGIYYHFADPRSQVETWQKIMEERAMFHRTPLMSKASNDELKKQLTDVVNRVADYILNTKIRGTRLLATEDLVPLVSKVFASIDGLKAMTTNTSVVFMDQELHPIWVVEKNVSIDEVKSSEKFLVSLQRKEEPDEKAAEAFMGVCQTPKTTQNSLIEEFRKVCIDLGRDPKSVLIIEDGKNTTVSLDDSDLAARIGMAVSEKMGIPCAWDAEIGKATIEMNGITIAFGRKVSKKTE